MLVYVDEFVFYKYYFLGIVSSIVDYLSTKISRTSF